MGARAELSREMQLGNIAGTSARTGPEILPCPCCSSRDWRFAQKVRRASLSECLNCGLLATTSFLKNHGKMEELYDVTAENEAEYRRYYLGARLAFYKRILPRLRPFLTTARLLEIGSGYGCFLETASRAGWDAEGVEISSYACKVARSCGCKIQQADLLSLPVNAETYDVIAMWDVIEHFPHPEEIIRRCVELLRPGGALILRTPDARALNGQAGLFRSAYRHLAYPANTPEHVFHFTPEHLTSMLKGLGLDDVQVDPTGTREESVISGKNAFVRAGRRIIMRYALALEWPYEFVAMAKRPELTSAHSDDRMTNPISSH
jgi:2-polyprenyl-3-methyl-5-hydroxy-6-metoxy-1,4-benzoquinol methylase